MGEVGAAEGRAALVPVGSVRRSLQGKERGGGERG